MIEDIKGYLGIAESEELPYDIMLVDADDYRKKYKDSIYYKLIKIIL